jgi:hypothetical protein
LRIPSPRSRRPLIAALRGLWTLPTNAIGHAVGLLATRSRPSRIGSAAARASLYLLPRGSRVSALGAVTLGDVIICAPEFLAGEERRRVVLAHELSHVRQHGWLGPFYLPLHALAQSRARSSISSDQGRLDASALYNLLEERFLCVPFSEIAASDRRSPSAGAGPRRIRRLARSVLEFRSLLERWSDPRSPPEPCYPVGRV